MKKLNTIIILYEKLQNKFLGIGHMKQSFKFLYSRQTLHNSLKISCTCNELKNPFDLISFSIFNKKNKI